MNDLPELLTLREASIVLKVHPNTLRLWDEKNILKAIRIGQRKVRRYRKKDIFKLLEGNQNSKKRDDKSQEAIPKRQALDNLANYKAIIFSSHDAIIGKTPDGIITSWNPASEKLYGYTAAEIIGKSILTIYPKGQKQEFLEIMRKIRSGERIDHYQTTRVRKDGKKIHVSVSISPVKNQEGVIVNVSTIARDITKQKQVEEKLKFLTAVTKELATSVHSRVTLNKVLSVIVPFLADYCRIAIVNHKQTVKEIIVVHKDPKKLTLVKNLNKKYKNFRETSMGIRGLLRTGKPQLLTTLNKKILEKYPVPDDIQKVVKKLNLKSYMGIPLIVRGKIIGAMTFSSISEDRLYTNEDLELAQEIGRQIALMIDNNRLYQEALREIRDRKRIEEKIKQNEERFRVLFEHSADGITILDKSGKRIYATPSRKNILGWDPKEGYKDNIFKILHPDDVVRIKKDFAQVLQNPKESITTTFRVRHKEGGWVWVEATGTNLLHIQIIGGVVINYRDITERKQIENRKDDFISMASHELKTPVTSVKAFAQILQKLPEIQNTKSKVYLEKMDTQINKLTKLIIDLLDVSKIHKGKLDFREEKFDFDQLVEETVDTISQTVSTHRILIEGKTNSKIIGDTDRISQVIINLLTNAVKYSPKADEVIVRLARSNNTVIMAVQDFGIGIPVNHQQKIFERFYRVNESEDRSFAGLGIGLYISSEIISRHGGEMFVKSKTGEGSIFSFILPIKQKKTLKTA